MTNNRTKKKSRGRQPATRGRGGGRTRGGRAGSRAGGGGTGTSTSSDDQWAADIDAFLARAPPIDPARAEEVEREAAEINAEVAQEQREARAGDPLLVVGASRPDEQPPNAGEAGFREAIAEAVDTMDGAEAAPTNRDRSPSDLVAQVVAAAPSLYARTRRGAGTGRGADTGTATDRESDSDTDRATDTAADMAGDASDDGEELPGPEQEGGIEVIGDVGGAGDDDDDIEDEAETEVQFAAAENTNDAVMDVEMLAAAEGGVGGDDAHDAVVALVEKMRIVPNTRLSYNRANFKLVSYLLDNGMAHIVLPTQREVFAAADEKDKEKQSTRKSRRNLRAAVMAALKDSVPLNLSAITYQIFSQYIVSCRRDNGEYMSFSHYNSKRSAFTHLFFEAEEEMDDERWNKIATLFAGLRRLIARQNQQLGKRATSGRDRMPFSVYQFICKKLREDGGSDAIFAHCIFTLSWSLMSRSESMTIANVQHIDWHDDCLVIYFHHRKTDQLGLNKNEPWHIYANPIDPDVCPHLALSVYLLTFDTILAAGNKLFQGPDPYNRYSEALLRIGKKHAEEIGAMGMDVKYLGVYSVRKGAGTYVTAGCTVAPPIISVCLRAGWSIGNVKERYLHYESAGDMYVARMATGLDVMSKDFAVSPPYFEGDESVSEAVDEWVLAVAGEGVKDYPHLRLVVKYLLASFCYHREYLKSAFPPNSPFFSSIAFATMPSDAEAVVNASVVRYPWNKTSQTPKLTGIPPHVAIICKLEELQEEVAGLKNDLSGLPKTIEEIPTKIMDSIGDGRSIIVHQHGGGGGGGGGGGDNAELVQKVQEMTRHFDEMREGQSGTAGSNDDGIGSDQTAGALPPFFKWRDGTTNRLPEDYKFTRGLILKSFIREYLIGKTRPDGRKIPPMRILRAKDVKHVSKSAHKRLAEMKELMALIKRLGLEKSLWKGDAMRHWTADDCTKLYDGVYDNLKLTEGEKKKRRATELSWSTAYNDCIRSKKQKRQRTK